MKRLKFATATKRNRIVPIWGRIPRRRPLRAPPPIYTWIPTPDQQARAQKALVSLPQPIVIFQGRPLQRCYQGIKAMPGNAGTAPQRPRSWEDVISVIVRSIVACQLHLGGATRCLMMAARGRREMSAHVPRARCR
jgi:hypothetical protein